MEIMGFLQKENTKIIPALISIVMLLFYVVPIFRGIFNLGNAFGIAVTAALTLVFVFFGRFTGCLRALWNVIAGRTFLCTAAVLIVLFVTYAAVVSALMVRAANDTPKTDDTTLVVLGCKVKNGAPSRMLRKRLDKAYDYLAEHESVSVVVSGGKGSDEAISEAECMKTYLTERGIAPERVYMEDRSVNTEENLRFSQEIIMREGLSDNITIVTDAYHQYRAEMIARKQGINGSSNISADTSWYLVPTYWTRELIGIGYYYLK